VVVGMVDDRPVVVVRMEEGDGVRWWNEGGLEVDDKGRGDGVVRLLGGAGGGVEGEEYY
jgi:hypothetical protein